MKKNLQDDIVDHVILNKNILIQDESYIHELPQNLKVELILALRRSLIQKSRLLRKSLQLSNRWVALVLAEGHSLLLRQAEYAYFRGDPVPNVYFVVKGSVEIVKDFYSSGSHNKELSEGSLFGQSLPDSNLATENVRVSSKWCRLMWIPKARVEYIAKMHSDFAKTNLYRVLLGAELLGAEFERSESSPRPNLRRLSSLNSL